MTITLSFNDQELQSLLRVIDWAFAGVRSKALNDVNVVMAKVQHGMLMRMQEQQREQIAAAKVAEKAAEKVASAKIEDETEVNAADETAPKAKTKSPPTKPSTTNRG